MSVIYKHNFAYILLNMLVNLRIFVFRLHRIQSFLTSSLVVSAYQSKPKLIKKKP